MEYNINIVGVDTKPKQTEKLVCRMISAYKADSLQDLNILVCDGTLMLTHA